MKENQTIDTIFNRKSVRKYSEERITEKEKELILQSAMQAPTAGGMMLYSIIEVNEQSKKERLAESCDHQPFIAKAPYALLFLADYQRWFDYYQYSKAPESCAEFNRQPRHPAEGDLLLSCMDALIAAQTSVIAAESLGISSCYIGDIIENYEFIQELFSLPRYCAPIALICFGRPTPDQISRKKTERFPKKFIVYQDTYRRFSDREFAEMDAARQPNASLDSENPMKRLNPGQFNYIRKFTAPFSLEMTRSVRKMLQNWQEDSPFEKNN